MGCAASAPLVKGDPSASAHPPAPRGDPQPYKFSELYKLGVKLGAGGFATVKLCHRLGTSEEFAVKMMPLPAEGTAPGAGATRQEILNEIKVLAAIDHTTCLRLKEWFSESDGKCLIVTEYVRGGELLEALTQKGSYNESDARAVFKQLLDGLEYLHGRGIVHRDLKLENLMLSKTGNLTEGLKIVDFGLARFGGPFDEDDMCGTPLYVAPESVGAAGPNGVRGAAAVTVAVDCWAAGVVLYMLLSGRAPFMHSDDSQLFRLICKGELNFRTPEWAKVSAQSKELIKALIVVKPDRRMTAPEARRHAWFGADVPSEDLTEAQDGLRKLAARRRFKGAVKAVKAIGRLKLLTTARLSSADADAEAEATGEAEAAAPAAEEGAAPAEGARAE